MKGGGGTYLKKFKTRRNLIALLAALCVLGAGGIAGSLAAKSRADVKKDGTRISKIREIEEGAFDASSSSSSSSSSASSSSTLEASMPGIVSVSPAPDVQGVNTTASIASTVPMPSLLLSTPLQDSQSSPSSSTPAPAPIGTALPTTTRFILPIPQARALTLRKSRRLLKAGTM